VALLPNAEVFTSRIINNTADPVRRGNVEMTLDDKADLDALIPRGREAAQRAEGVLERPVTARIEDLGPMAPC
jgi:small-conductance mechanosensitive channel